MTVLITQVSAHGRLTSSGNATYTIGNSTTMVLPDPDKKKKKKKKKKKMSNKMVCF